MDYWPATKKLLGDSNFLVDLKQYDIDNIPVSIAYNVELQGEMSLYNIITNKTLDF